MNISINWIKDFVDIKDDVDLNALAQDFTLRVAEVEHIVDEKKEYENMVVGQIKKISDHSDADKLKVTQTDIGGEVVQIVCGGPNIYEGMMVPVAKVGAEVRWHGEGDKVVMKKAKIRGVESLGMICAGDEIGLNPTPEGVLDLSDLKPRVGDPLYKVLKKDDFILEIDNKSLTHRPDLWGHYGIAREIAVLLDEKLKPFKVDVSYPKSGEKLEVEVKDTDKCRRYIGVKIENVKIGPSPKWMQDRLIATGHSVINNVVDATNYVMEELGQPLHAFDAKKVSLPIVVRTAYEGEEIVTLDGESRELSSDMLLIADKNNGIAIAGVMGGANSQIDDDTSEIILEAANFDPASVRNTSVKLNLRTDAVQRFEKSLDPNLPAIAMDRLCELILKISPGARIVSKKVDVKNFDDKPKKILLEFEEVRKKIGVFISDKDIVSILEKLEFVVDDKGDGTAEVVVPSFRATKDVLISDDLVEEVARIYGYNNIEAVLPSLPARLPRENNERKLKHFARNIFSIGLSYTEVYNYSFYSKDDVVKSGIPEEFHLQIENYLSEEQTHLRVSLVPNLLKNVGFNLKYFDEFKIYEVGRTYEDLQEFFPIEEKKIAGFVVKKKFKGEIFYEAKADLESFLSFFAVGRLEFRKGETLCPYAHPVRFGGYYDKKTGEEIARVFELHPLVAHNYDLKNVKIAGFEVNFSKLSKLGLKKLSYSAIAKYPGISIDVSVLLDKEKVMRDVILAILKSDSLIRDVSLFDFYEGENIPKGKKAVAFKVLLQSDERTLSDKDMKVVQEKIFRNLKEIGGEIRGI